LIEFRHRMITEVQTTQAIAVRLDRLEIRGRLQMFVDQLDIGAVIEKMIRLVMDRYIAGEWMMALNKQIAGG
jgi:hypothetical protein